MDWLFGGFMLLPFCLVSTCGIPLLVLIVVLFVRSLKTDSRTDPKDDEWEKLSPGERQMLNSAHMKADYPDLYNNRSERRRARQERLDEEERKRKEGR